MFRKGMPPHLEVFFKIFNENRSEKTLDEILELLKKEGANILDVQIIINEELDLKSHSKALEILFESKAYCEFKSNVINSTNAFEKTIHDNDDELRKMLGNNPKLDRE